MFYKLSGKDSACEHDYVVRAYADSQLEHVYVVAHQGLIPSTGSPIILPIYLHLGNINIYVSQVVATYYSALLHKG